MSRQVRLSIPSLNFVHDFYLPFTDHSATPELIAHALKTGQYKFVEIIRTEEEIEHDGT